MVRFETRLNSDVTAAINNRAQRRFKPMLKIVGFIFIVIGVLILLDAIIPDAEHPSNAFEKSFGLAMGVFFTVFGFLYFPLVKVLSRFMQKRVDATMNIIGNDAAETFTFDENGLVIESERPGIYKSLVEASYKYLFRVEEDIDCFYLLISKVQSHVIFKKQLTEGSMQEFYGLLSTNFSDVKTLGKTTIYYNKLQKIKNR